MLFLEKELTEIRKHCEHVVHGSKLISCDKTLVRAEIKRTQFKAMAVCIQFPENYPKTPLSIELKSKSLSDKLLPGLRSICEQEAKKYLGKAQVLNVMTFLRKFIDENPLCCCYDEINFLKKVLGEKNELQWKQKSSTLVLKIVNKNYYLNCKIFVPDNYPDEAVDVEETGTNFSPAFVRQIIDDAKEIARKCVEPPLRRKRNHPLFEASPSLKKTVEFFLDCVKRLPVEECQFCKKACFPSDPRQLEFDEESPRHIERVRCGHLFHLDCLFLFMRTNSICNKKCGTCGMRIFHGKWSERFAEERWNKE